jgi:quinol monooxygenase YgiN
MYARVSIAQIRPATGDQVLAVWQQQIIPALRQQRGFRRVQLLHDPRSERTMSLSVWDSEADADASRSSDFMRQALAALGPFHASLPDQHHMELVLDESV